MKYEPFVQPHAPKFLVFLELRMQKLLCINSTMVIVNISE